MHSGNTRSAGRAAYSTRSASVICSEPTDGSTETRCSKPCDTTAILKIGLKPAVLAARWSSGAPRARRATLCAPLARCLVVPGKYSWCAFLHVFAPWAIRQFFCCERVKAIIYATRSTPQCLSRLALALRRIAPLRFRGIRSCPLLWITLLGNVSPPRHSVATDTATTVPTQDGDAKCMYDRPVAKSISIDTSFSGDFDSCWWSAASKRCNAHSLCAHGIH